MPVDKPSAPHNCWSNIAAAAVFPVEATMARNSCAIYVCHSFNLFERFHGRKLGLDVFLEQISKYCMYFVEK